MSNKLYVGGLSWNTTAEALTELFAAVGEVTEAEVVSDSISGRSRGYGFVTFASLRDAREARLALDGSTLDGNIIEVADAENRSSPHDARQPKRRW